VIAVLLLWQQRRNNGLTFFAITFFAATTMWWQEWYADWARYLRFSGEFALIPWYASTWAAPTKPWAVIAGYGWFIGLAVPAIVPLVNRATRNRTGAGRYLLAAAITAPIFWAIDIAVEAVATALNWWEYTNPTGPVIKTHSKRRVPNRLPVAGIRALGRIDRFHPDAARRERILPA
jgi:hypothetical protein